MRVRTVALTGALAAFAAAFAALPFVVSTQHAAKGRNLMLQDAPLGGNQVQRGAYLNSGSRDAGRDPDWVRDPVTGRLSFVGRGSGATATASPAAVAAFKVARGEEDAAAAAAAPAAAVR